MVGLGISEPSTVVLGRRSFPFGMVAGYGYISGCKTNLLRSWNGFRLQEKCQGQKPRALRILQMSCGVKTTRFETPRVSIGGSGVPSKKSSNKNTCSRLHSQKQCTNFWANHSTRTHLFFFLTFFDPCNACNLIATLSKNTTAEGCYDTTVDSEDLLCFTVARSKLVVCTGQKQ